MNLEDLAVRLIGDASSYLRMLSTAAQATESTARTIQAATARIERLGTGLRSFGGAAIATLAGVGLIAGGAGLARHVVQLTSDAEQMQLSFEVMTRSAEQGQQLFRELIHFAAITPLTLPDVAQGAQALLQYGVSADQAIPILRALGDVSRGNAEGLQHMVHAYGIARSMGYATAREWHMMVRAGFNPIRELSIMTGETEEAITRRMHQGMLSIQEITRALQHATGEGGNWFQMMARQSQTVAGLFSTLRDDVGAASRSIGKVLFEALNFKDLIRAGSNYAQAFTRWFDALDTATQTSIVRWGTFVLALLAASPIIYFVLPMMARLFLALPLAIARAVLSLSLWATSIALQVTAWLAWAAVMGIVYMAMGVWYGMFFLAKVLLFTLTAIIWVFNASLVAVNAIIFALVITIGLWDFWVTLSEIGTVLWTAATWLLNASLVALNLLLSPASLLTFAAAAIVVVLALGAVTAAIGVVVGLFSTIVTVGGAVIDIFSNLGEAGGFLSQVTGILGEWWTILKQVAFVAQSDMPAAWNILAAGAKLAVNQVKDLWAPLWMFIKTGFMALWDLVTTVFVGKMTQAGNQASLAIAQSILSLPGLSTFLGIDQEDLQASMDQMNTAVDQGINLQIQNTERRLRRAMEAFNVVESEQTEEARAELFDALWDAAEINTIGQAANNAGITVGENFNRGAIREIHKFDNVLAGSAEAMARIEEHVAMHVGAATTASGAPVVAAAPRPAPPAGGAPSPQEVAGGGAGGEGGGAWQMVATLLAQIRDGILAGNAQQPVVVEEQVL